MSQAKHWCFTLNNYSDDEIPRSLPTGAVYLVFGKEIGESGTPHLQGFVSFGKPRRLSQVSRIIARAYWSVARNLSAAPEYCKKDGDFQEFGEPPTSLSKQGKPGRRNELPDFMASVKGGNHDPKKLREEHPNVWARYPRFAESYIRDHLPSPVVEEHPLRDWQGNVLALLEEQPSDREILFLVDLQGNAGKSWFARYVRSKFPALILGAGKKTDLSYAFSKCLPYPKIVFIDCPRCKADTLHYDFLEELKNGLLFVSKYESCFIEFPVPHVVVLMNEHPDMTKLTADRYNIININ